MTTKAITIVELIQGLRGGLHLTFEEGTWSAWLYDLLNRTSGRSWCAIRLGMPC